MNSGFPNGLFYTEEITPYLNFLFLCSQGFLKIIMFLAEGFYRVQGISQVFIDKECLQIKLELLTYSHLCISDRPLKKKMKAVCPNFSHKKPQEDINSKEYIKHQRHMCIQM